MLEVNSILGTSHISGFVRNKQVPSCYRNKQVPSCYSHPRVPIKLCIQYNLQVLFKKKCGVFWKKENLIY